MHAYRTHKCHELRKDNAEQEVRLSGWIHKIRDHGGVLFIDLRDTYGITQCVIDADSPLIEAAQKWRNESVLTITGTVKARIAETVNDKMPTGEIEVYIKDVDVQSAADVIPFQVADEDQAGEEIRLRHRYIDLRREKMQKNIRLRNNVIRSMRERMYALDFQEFQTPILTASSPEGARDYLVPSRLHPGKFYALPQAPQQFKQLLMMGGFDKYFQIAPCFRDEDGRADRLAEFYQMDVEMSFVTQDDVFNTIQPVVNDIFEQFSDFTGEKRRVEWVGHIPYAEAMLKYGSDKPNLLRRPVALKMGYERNQFFAAHHQIHTSGSPRSMRICKRLAHARKGDLRGRHHKSHHVLHLRILRLLFRHYKRRRSHHHPQAPQPRARQLAQPRVRISRLVLCLHPLRRGYNQGPVHHLIVPNY